MLQSNGLYEDIFDSLGKMKCSNGTKLQEERDAEQRFFFFLFFYLVVVAGT